MICQSQQFQETCKRQICFSQMKHSFYMCASSVTNLSNTGVEIWNILYILCMFPLDAMINEAGPKNLQNQLRIDFV